MKIKGDPISENLGANNAEIVSWDAKLATGITSIDKQHKELVELTNKLFHACLSKQEDVDSTFREAMSRLVEYVRHHFSDEQVLLERIKFPNYTEHKKEHDSLIKEILEASKDYGAGKKFVPNHFARLLKDWIFGHIMLTDMLYAAYVREQKQKGLLADL